jgi:hypothetical protein
MGERAVPILSTRTLHESFACSEALGFENPGAPTDQWDYRIVGRGGMEIHVAQALDDAWAGIVVTDPTTDSRGVAPMDTDDGLREYAVVDRRGNLVRVGSPLVP